MRIPIVTQQGLPSAQAGRVFSLGAERKRPREIPRTEEAVWGEVRNLAERATNISTKLVDLENAELASKALLELNEGTNKIIQDMTYNHQKYGGIDMKAHEDSFEQQYENLTEDINRKYIKNEKIGKYMSDKFKETRFTSMNTVHKLGWGRQYDRGRATFSDLTSKYMNAYLDPKTNDTQKMAYVKHHQEMSNAYVAAGYFSEEEALGYHQKFVDTASKAFWQREIDDNPTAAFKALSTNPPESFKNLDEATRMSILATAEKNADAERIANVKSQITEAPIQTYIDMQGGKYPEGWKNLNPDEQYRIKTAARVAYDSNVRAQWLVDIAADPKKAYFEYKNVKDTEEFGWLREPTKREIEVRVQAAYDKQIKEDETTELFNMARGYLADHPGDYAGVIPQILDDVGKTAQSRSQVANMLRTEETRTQQREDDNNKITKANYKSKIFDLHMKGDQVSVNAALALVNATGKDNPLTGEERFDLTAKLATAPDKWVTDNNVYREISVDIEKGLITDPVTQIYDRMGPTTLSKIDADKLNNKWRQRNTAEDNPKYTFELKQALKHGFALHKELYPKMSGDKYKVEEFLLDQYFNAVQKKQKDIKDENAQLTASEYIAINEESLLTIAEERKWYLPWFLEDDLGKTEWELYTEKVDEVREERNESNSEEDCRRCEGT
jgi:hypothetical protein